MFRLRQASTSVVNCLKRVADRGHPVSVKSAGQGQGTRVLLVRCGLPQHWYSTVADRQPKSALTSLRERGLYDDVNLFRHVKSWGVNNFNIEGNGKYLDITWEDGHVSRFHAIWLRHGCHCPECRLDHNGTVTVDFAKIDVQSLRVVSATIEDDAIVIIKWEDTANNTIHEGPMPAAWLRQNCYSERNLKDQRAQRAMHFHENKIIPEIDWKEVEQSEMGVYKWVKNISDYGICLLKNVPTEKGMVAKVAEKIAPVQHSVYGEVFDVVSTPEPINPAYSAVKLDLHMDQPHYESPPGLQLLHCIEFDPNIIGGENTFADIHEMALALKEQKPEYFKTLTRVPMTMQTLHYNRDWPVHLRIQRPLISLNHVGEMVSVIWHPMLVGPLQVPEEDVEPFYEAYSYFYTLVSTYKSVFKLRMIAGDAICFNNRRVLHGRASYSNQQGLRMLQGTYVEISEYQSKVQVLHNKYGEGQLATRSGSLDWQ